MCSYCGEITTNTNGFCSLACRSESVTTAGESAIEIERRYQAALAVVRHRRRSGAYAAELERLAVSRTSDACVEHGDHARSEVHEVDVIMHRRRPTFNGRARARLKDVA